MHQTMMTAHGMERVVLPEHKPLIFGIFGAGFAGVMLVQLLLYRHAWTLRDVLGLDEFERFETRHAIRRLTAATAVGLSYFGVAVGESLPSHTPSEKRFAVIFAYSILAILIVLMVWMARLIRERRRVKAEWKAKREPTPVEVGEGE
jgi:hypothetical protein